MFERTTFHLRMADHATTTARINATDWQRQGEPKQPTLRPARASVQRFTQPV